MQFFFLCISNFLRFALAYLGMCTDLCLRKHKAVWTVDVCWWEIKKEWSRKVVDKFYTFALFLVRFSHLSSVYGTSNRFKCKRSRKRRTKSNTNCHCSRMCVCFFFRCVCAFFFCDFSSSAHAESTGNHRRICIAAFS